jgi:hypothetical protein
MSIRFGAAVQSSFNLFVHENPEMRLSADMFTGHDAQFIPSLNGVLRDAQSLGRLGARQLIAIGNPELRGFGEP